jgi:hypothetical protein
VRRSSTSRSIGNRSDFESAFTPDTPGAESVVDEDDDHVSQYVESQLQRVRSQASMGTYEDEFETTADQTPNGH